MKEKLYMIPLNDAIDAKDECPFCYIERTIEQNLLDFTLGTGSSYMESNIREKTDQEGFCKEHSKKLFQYGNTLGNAWILKSRMQKVRTDFTAAAKKCQIASPVSSARLLPSKKELSNIAPMLSMIQHLEDNCYICNQFNEHYARYRSTFFELYLKDPVFHDKVMSSKGFCLPHFKDLIETASGQLNRTQQAQFFPPMFSLMEKNLDRLYDDVSWMVEKFDYRNKDADWKTSKDSIQNCMQKLKSGYPSDPPYTQKL